MKKLIPILLAMVLTVPSLANASPGTLVVNTKDKLISPWMLTVVGETPYVLDGTDLVKIEKGKRKVLTSLRQFNTTFESKGIAADDDWHLSAIGGMLQERNGSLYFSYFLTELSDAWENPFLQDDEKPNQGSGWQYIGIWKYSLATGETTTVYFEKARYWPGYADDDFYETKSGDPQLFSFQGQAVQYLGYQRYLGRFYVDEDENIWGIWQKNKYEDDIRAHIWRIDREGNTSVAWDTKPQYGYGTPIDMSNERNDNWGYVFPHGKDLILVDGGWRMYTLKIDYSSKLTVDEDVLAFYREGVNGYPKVTYDHPRVIDDQLYVLADSGVWRFNWNAKRGKELWQSVYKPKSSDGRLSIQDFAISDKGNLYLLNYPDGTIRMIPGATK